MEKEFVPYEQVLALKELGFDKPCFGYYNSNREFVYGSHTNNEMQRFRYSVPTFSQAFRWFRENYGLFHSITEYNKDGSLIIEISKDRVEIFRKMTNFDFTEYREAELACLTKLIEIVEGIES